MRPQDHTWRTLETMFSVYCTPLRVKKQFCLFFAVIEFRDDLALYPQDAKNQLSTSNSAYRRLISRDYGILKL